MLSILLACTHWWVRQLKRPDRSLGLGHPRRSRFCQVWLCYYHWMVTWWHKYCDFSPIWACQSWQLNQHFLRLWKKDSSKRSSIRIVTFCLLVTVSTGIFLETINWDNAKGSRRRLAKEAKTRIRLWRWRWSIRLNNALVDEWNWGLRPKETQYNGPTRLQKHRYDSTE